MCGLKHEPNFSPDFSPVHISSISDGHFNFYSRLNADGGLRQQSKKDRQEIWQPNTPHAYLVGYNLLHCLSSAVQINDTLVYPHLVLVPRLGTLPTRSLASGNPQDFSGHAYGSFHLQLRVSCTTNQITTNYSYLWGCCHTKFPSSPSHSLSPHLAG